MSIICTLSHKQTMDRTLLKKLMRRGTKNFRFNASYLSAEQINEAALALRETAKGLNVRPEIYVDLPGAKRRIGQLYKDRVPIKKEQPVKFIFGIERVDEDLTVPVPESELYEKLETGDIITLKDGKLKFVIKSMEPATKSAVCLSHDDYVLESYWGYAVPGKKLGAAKFYSPEMTLLRRVDFNLITALALSYTENADMVISLRFLLEKLRVSAKLAAKIETLEGFANIGAIAGQADEVWFCRGDFGNNIPLVELFRYEAELLKLLPLLGSPILVAGENAMQAINDEIPSRGEISHLSFLFAQGVEGVVLSDETVKAKDPVAVYHFVNKLEKKYFVKKRGADAV